MQRGILTHIEGILTRAPCCLDGALIMPSPLLPPFTLSSFLGLRLFSPPTSLSFLFSKFLYSRFSPFSSLSLLHTSFLLFFSASSFFLSHTSLVLVLLPILIYSTYSSLTFLHFSFSLFLLALLLLSLSYSNSLVMVSSTLPFLFSFLFYSRLSPLLLHLSLPPLFLIRYFASLTSLLFPFISSSLSPR